MVRCWKHSENSLEEAQCTDGGSAASSKSHFPHKAFWVSLSASLLLVVIALGVIGHLRLSQPHSESLQLVRITVPDQTGVLINQSAIVDQKNDLVTFSVTSPTNQTSTVMFDIKHGLICYKPVNQESCFLRKMEKSDYDNVHSLLNDSAHKQSQFQLSGNETQRQTEFLGVMAASQVDVSTLEEPLQALCQDSSVHWTRRVEGENLYFRHARGNRGWSTSASTSAFPATSACPCASTTCPSDCAFSSSAPSERSGKQSCLFSSLYKKKKIHRTKASFDCFLCAIQPPVNQ
uniref:BRICHOS domain-containing protein 5 isoform X3 n=1 Tax=Epinephelus lanceolatus TaxID=310571 RepID=UPI001446764D|nr:BRICHOS domain-containing protein 5 isoform X3 [Epinephelus lanceolatus]XP_033473806.1 BRICHOS domain-containing protein 5-like isoform X3 [Epinephelus lanceolatus]